MLSFKFLLIKEKPEISLEENNHKSKIADYGKLPLLVFNKPIKFTNFEKL